MRRKTNEEVKWKTKGRKIKIIKKKSGWIMIKGNYEKWKEKRQKEEISRK